MQGFLFRIQSARSSIFGGAKASLGGKVEKNTSISSEFSFILNIELWIFRYFQSVVVDRIDYISAFWHYCSYTDWMKWQQHPVTVNFDDKITSIGMIPFQAVNVCTTQKLKELVVFSNSSFQFPEDMFPGE